MTGGYRLLTGTESYPDFSIGTLTAIERAVARRDSAPTVILNVFDRDGITIGCNEDPNQVLDLATCAAHRIAFRRRLNGGGTIYAPAGSCNIAFVVPKDTAGLPQTAAGSFERFLPLVAATTERRFGIAARWRPLNDIEVEGRKLMPTSIKIDHGVLTFRIMVNVKAIDTALAARAMPMPPEKVRDKIHKDIGGRFTCLEGELGRPVETGELVELTRDLGAALLLAGDIVPGVLSPAEGREAARILTESDRPHWNFARSEAQLLSPVLRPGDRVGHGREKAPGGMIWVAVAVRDGRLVRAILNGDFPARPANAPARIEERLADVPATAEAIRAELERCLAGGELELAGVGVDALMVAFTKAIADAGCA